MNIVHTKDELPIILQPRDVAKILGRSNAYVYTMFGRSDFPAIVASDGNHAKYVFRDSFFKWLQDKERKPDGLNME